MVKRQLCGGNFPRGSCPVGKYRGLSSRGELYRKQLSREQFSSEVIILKPLAGILENIGFQNLYKIFSKHLSRSLFFSKTEFMHSNNIKRSLLTCAIAIYLIFVALLIFAELLLVASSK